MNYRSDIDWVATEDLMLNGTFGYLILKDGSKTINIQEADTDEVTQSLVDKSYLKLMSILYKFISFGQLFLLY